MGTMYKSGSVPQYDYDWIREDRELARDCGCKPFSFISGLGNAAPIVPGDMDCYDIYDRLLNAGVVTKRTDADNESCCMYIYFSTRKAGENFIDRLNKYLRKKASMMRKVSDF